MQTKTYNNHTMKSMLPFAIFYLLCLEVALGGGPAADDSLIDSIGEGPCMMPPPTNIKMSKEFSAEFLNGKVYSPFASKLYYYYVYQAAKNEPPTSADFEQFEKKLCPCGVWEPNNHRIAAYGAEVKVNCTSNADWSQIQCVCGNNKKNFGSLVVTWTDYKDTAVVLVCVSEGYRAWAVYSKVDKISAETKASVEQHIKAFGFNPGMAEELKYDTCPKEDMKGKQ